MHRNEIAASTALQARYREPVAGVEGIAGRLNETLATLLGHRSVRAYAPTPLAQGTVELLVAAAQSASTSSNKQFWSVVAIEDAGRRTRLARLAGNQKHIEQAPLQLVWLADLSRIRAIADAAGASVAAVDYLESFLVAVIDAALAAQNAAVAAEALGLGIVYIGAMRNRPEAVAEELGLPPGCFAVFGMCVGHPDPAAGAEVKPRLPQAAVLHRERYQVEQQDAIERYDGHHRAFRAEQGMSPIDWTAHMIDRLATPAALSGRDRLGEALTRLGFRLE